MYVKTGIMRQKTNGVTIKKGSESNDVILQSITVIYNRFCDRFFSEVIVFLNKTVISLQKNYTLIQIQR